MSTGCHYKDLYRALQDGQCYQIVYERSDRSFIEGNPYSINPKIIGEVEEIPEVFDQILSTFRFLPDLSGMNYGSPNGALRAQVISIGKTQESRVQIRTSEGTLLQEADYTSEDGDHGLSVVNAEWTPDSQFFVYSAKSSGGHQPWHGNVFFYSRLHNKVYDFYTLSNSGTIDNTFVITAPDIVTVTIYTSPGMSESQVIKSFKLSDLLRQGK